MASIYRNLFALATDVGLKEGTGAGVETLNTGTGLAAGIELSPDLLGQDLAKLDAPLIEGVESPDEALGGGTMLVDGQKLPNRKGIQTGHEHRTGGAVALKDLVRTKGLIDTLGDKILQRLAIRQSIGLREEVGHELIVVGNRLSVHVNRCLTLAETNEIGRYDPSLVHELVERMLSVGAGLSKVDLTGLEGQGRAIDRHALAVGFHIDLLDVSREALQGLRVRQKGAGGISHERGVPNTQQTEQDGNVLSQRSIEEMLVHIMGTVQEGTHHLIRVAQTKGDQSDGTAHRETSADPIPESKDVGLVDTERGGLVNGGTDGTNVLGDDVLLLGDAGLGQTVEHPLLGRAGVQHGLGRGEGLGDDDDEGLLRIEVAGAQLEVDGVDVGQEAEGASLGGGGGRGIGTEGLGDELRAELRSADADAHVVLEGLAGGTDVLAGADLGHEGFNGIPDGMDVRQDRGTLGGIVLGVVVSLGHAEGVVEDGSALGGVDLDAAAHLGALGGQAGLVGQIKQKFHGLAGHLLAAVVQDDLAVGTAGGRGVGGDEAGAAAGIAAQMTQVELVVGLERGGRGLEGGPLGRVGALDHFADGC